MKKITDEEMLEIKKDINRFYIAILIVLILLILSFTIYHITNQPLSDINQLP